ncbi:hypothetical protein O9992_22055 [Vibrio lentus]|nr:hypothetical protein [Vibrio lentus]
MLALAVILWDFDAVYRLFNLQIQLDNVTYNFVNAVSLTQLKPKPQAKQGCLLIR